MRIAFLCMESAFSVRPLEALLAAGHDVRLVMRPVGGTDTRTSALLRRHRGFDVAVKRLFSRSSGDAKVNPLAVAARNDIPAYLVGDASTPAVRALFAKERIELVVIAFFNQLLRAELLAQVPLGAINLHPSALPRGRGPAPLFWTFHAADPETALTAHRLDVREDGGAILLQEAVPVPFGCAGEDLVDSLADVGARMIVPAVEAVARDHLAGTPQDDTSATRAPRPRPADLVLNPRRGGRTLFTFVRGMGRYHALVLPAGDKTLRAIDAVAFDAGRSIPGEQVLVGNELMLRTDDGVVTLLVQGHTI